MALVTYDEFMVRPFGERLTLFNQVTAENRAHLVQAHLTRWLARERVRLRPEQVAVLEKALSLITPAWYRRPSGNRIRSTVNELDEKASRVLSREDMMQALTIGAHYIPPSEEPSK